MAETEDRTGSLGARMAADEEISSVSKIQSEPLRVLMAAGGTGGHIFPALAVAQELVARANEDEREEVSRAIVFLGTTRGLESRLIPAAGFPLQTVAAAGLKGIRGWKRLANLLVLPRSAFAAARVLWNFRPQVVVGIGGYLAGPVMLEAALMGIPTLLIEPNAVPGFTNRTLARVVRGAAVGFGAAAEFYGTKARVTGHAVRKAFFAIPPKKHVTPFTLVVVGGSQGSRAINECVVKSLKLLASASWKLSVVHQTGELDYNNVREMYRAAGIGAEVCAFIDDVPKAFARADLIVSRAGAAAVAELAAAGKAALLIPFPGATDQHQRENARVLERAGAAQLIDQAEMTPELLAAQIRELFDRPELLAQMEQLAKELAHPNAAKEIADWVTELGKNP
ncbi:MAG TPA: undecaprenyldiphospho-muramoylpentapeptide beta-N-acetylglucosaminyltransferase [Terriglobia bacterium]|nr:undecaprenyldiphospho-muramoylpentapeptide beta-N-acetylglucosaminyltransferase [Terriglobia bacterium]